MARAKKGEGSRAKLREYFLRNVGIILTSAELFDVSGGAHEFGRRIRELRNLEGMTILTHKDRSDLKPGQYIFLNTKSLPTSDKAISKGTRAKVLDRDGHTCQSCGVSAGEIHPFNGRKVTLQLGHIIDKSMGGGDDENNLQALCSVCNEGSSNITDNRPDFIKLKAQIKRAPKDVQLELLEWFITKFPNQSSEQLKKKS
jgi:hypothetical protein